MSAEVTLSLGQQDEIINKMAETKTLITLLVSASTGRDEFDLEGFAILLEDKFAELYDTYQTASGSDRRYRRCPTR
jgi:hypothetical protein